MSKILKGMDGERFPTIGGITEYRLAFTETIDISTIKDEEILWQVYWSNQYSEYEKVPFSGQKKGRVVTYKFLQNLLNKNLQLKATYKDETVELHITPQVNGEMKIVDVFFLDTEYKGQDKDNLKYLNSLNLQIYTLNMLGKSIDFKIYDTINGEEKEVYKNPASLQIIQKNGIVKTKQTITLTPFIPMQAQKDMSASEHIYKIKVWQTDNESNFYEEELKVKNELGQMTVPQDSQVPIKTGTSEPVKKKEEEKNDGKCFCEKEFSVDDIKSFYKSKNLFTHKDCPLPADQKTYIEFTKALNKAMKDNNINTCLRKAHFLAQIETESDRLNTTIEYASGWDYDHSTHYENYNKYLLFKRDSKSHKDYGTLKIKRGHDRYLECLEHGHNVKGYGPKYKGKGLIQLTWKDTYENYFNHINKPELIDTPNIVASNLSFSCDSAGWFWNNRKLGNYADKDDLIYISVRINGGLTGFEHRKSNVKSIIKSMEIETNCTNNKLKSIAKYKYETSEIKTLKWGKKHKLQIEKYDD